MSVSQQLNEYIKKTHITKQTPTDLSCLPVSGQLCENISTPIDAKKCGWWNHGNLFDTLDGLKKMKRLYHSPLRVTVLDRYKNENGLTMIGKVVSGRISIGDHVLIQPSSIKCTITHICVDDCPVESSAAGENVLISIENKNNTQWLKSIHCGSVICSINEPIPVVFQFNAKVRLIQNKIVTLGFQSILHIHNIQVLTEIIAIPHKINPKTG